MTLIRPQRKSLPSDKHRRRRSSAISRKPTYAERLVSIIQLIRVERRQSHSNPNYKAPGCNNKNVVHRRSILNRARRLTEANGDTFTVHDAKQFSRAEGDLAEAGVLQKVSNTGHYRLAHPIEQELDKSYKVLTTEEQSDPIVIGDIVRHATNQADRKRSPFREPSASPTKRRRTSLAPRFATLEPEYSVPPPSTRGQSQHPPPSQARSMPPPRQSFGPFKRKTRNSTGGRLEMLFEGSLSPPPPDEEESAEAQLEQARSNITRLNAELERYKALLDDREDPEHPPGGNGEQSLGSVVPDSEESRTVIPSANTATANVPPRSSIPYQSERQHPNRDLEEMDVTFQSTNDRTAPSSTHSSPVRPSVSAHGSFVLNDPSSSASAPRRALGRTGSNRGMVAPPHPTPPHTSDEEDDEEERDQEMNDSLFLGGAGASFDGVEDSYKVELSRHLAREEELKGRVGELESEVREKDERVKELEARIEMLQADTDVAVADREAVIQEHDLEIAELQVELSQKTEELKEVEEKYHGEILALEVANEDMTSRMETLETEKQQAVQNATAAQAEVNGKAAEVVDLQGRLQAAEASAQLSEARISTLEKEVEEREIRLTGAASLVEGLRGEIIGLEATNADLASRLDAAEAEKAQVTVKSSDAIAKLDAEVARLQANLATTQLELATTTADLVSRNMELAASQQRLIDLEQTMDETKLRLEDELASARNLLALNAGRLATATASNNELTQKLQLAETRLKVAVTEVARLSTNLTTSELQVASLEEQLEATNTELGTSKAQLDEVRKSKKRDEDFLNATISDLESKLSASANAHLQLAESIQSYQDQLRQSREAQNILHISLSRSRAQVDQLQESLNQQSRQAEDLVDQATALVEDKVALESSLVHASEVIKNLERQVSKADRKVARLSNNNQQLNVEKDEAMRDAEAMKLQKESVEQKVESMLAKYAEMKQKIAVVQRFMGQAVDAVNDVEVAIDSPIV